MPYNWIYTTSNENSYILFLIIVILGVIIINFNLWKRKTDKFVDISNYATDNRIDDTSYNILNDISNITTPQHIVDEILNLTPDQIAKRKILMDISNSNPYDNEPNNTQHNSNTQPTFTQNHIIEEKFNRESLSYAISKLDGDQESVEEHHRDSRRDHHHPHATQSNENNDIMQLTSSLYTSILTGDKSFQESTYSITGNYATLDLLGSSMTDTLGGIKSDLGYTLLDDQLGTFKPSKAINPYAYDNTANYRTSMNPAAVDGATRTNRDNGQCNYNGNRGGGGSPIFMQKDFTGVANIFAPNIIIANPPLTADGLPDISYKM